MFNNNYTTQPLVNTIDSEQPRCKWIPQLTQLYIASVKECPDLLIRTYNMYTVSGQIIWQTENDISAGNHVGLASLIELYNLQDCLKKMVHPLSGV